MSFSVCPVELRNELNCAAVGNSCFLAVSNAAWIWALVTVIPSLCASAWYQYALIRKSITWLESEVNSWLQSDLTVLSGVFASDGICLRTCAMQLVKFGGSFGTITGDPGV